MDDVNDEQIVDAIKLLARTEGIFAETAGGVTVGVTKKLIDAGLLDPTLTTVVLNTGDGLKTLDAVAPTTGPTATIRPSLDAFRAGRPGPLSHASRPRVPPITEGRHPTMSVKVRIPTILRTYTGGQAEVPAEGETLSEVIQSLEASHPGIAARVLDDEGKLRRFVNVYVNDDDVRFEQGLQTATPAGAADLDHPGGRRMAADAGSRGRLTRVLGPVRTRVGPLRTGSGGGRSLWLSAVELGTPPRGRCRAHTRTRQPGVKLSVTFAGTCVFCPARLAPERSQSVAMCVRSCPDFSSD